jgi:hypothetical protein
MDGESKHGRVEVACDMERRCDGSVGDSNELAKAVMIRCGGGWGE